MKSDSGTRTHQIHSRRQPSGTLVLVTHEAALSELAARILPRDGLPVEQ
jgi:hypothetical protein